MITAWTQHITNEEDKLQYEKSLRNSKWILERLGEILTDVEKGLDRQESSPKVYDQPNWDYRQAHANGFRQCLNKVQTLINLDQKENYDRQSI